MPQPGYKICPYCAEEIRESAIKCRYCQTMLNQPPNTVAPVIPPSISRYSKQEQTEIQRLAQFIPSKVMEGILTGSEMMEDGELRNITILFADLEGFTSLAEILNAESLKELIDSYLAEMSDIITKYDGTIDKFIGDAVMALFGAPIAHEDDPERALRTAEEMQVAITQIGKKFQRDLRVRIGISCGDVIVGSLGGKNRLDYSAIGDVVNLANRLQTQAKPGQIVVSQRIYERTQKSFAYDSLGLVELKGKLVPVPAYLLTKAIRAYDKIPIREISSIELIGRETELNLLLNAIKETKKGSGVVIHLKGEAGVGKTRLMYELRSKVQKLGMNAFYGRCLTYGKNSSYHPFIDLFIHGICRIPDTLSKTETAKQIEIALLNISTELKGYIPYLQFLIIPEEAPQSIIAEDPKTRMQHIFSAIQAVLEKLAQQQPLILELEDLQWADGLSLHLINNLISALANMPIAMFLVYRPYFSHAWVAGGKQITIELQELSERDSETLIHHLLGLYKLPPGLAEKIIKKTEGNPFYAEEVVLYLKQSGLLKLVDKRWELTQSLHEINIPDTIQGVVLSRIDRLETQVKRVLQCAAVIGYRFRHRVLDYVLAVERDLEKHLSRLVDANLILEQSLIPELEYLFRHAVTQEVTYNTLLVKRRKYFHEKIAQCLEEIYADRLDEHYELIAHHYAHSDAHGKALEYLVKAGDKCRKLFANEAAIEFYTLALDRMQYYSGTADHAKELEASILIHRGIVSELIGEIKPALTDNLKAAELVKPIPNNSLLIRAYQHVAELYRQLGKFEMAIDYAKMASGLCQKLGDKKAELHCTNRLAVIYRNLGKFDSALIHFQEVLKLGEEQKDLMLLAHAHNNLSLTYRSIGDYALAINHIQQAIKLREELSDQRGLVAGYNNLGILFEKQGKLNDALSAYGDCVRVSREIGYKKAEVAAKNNIGWLYWLQGKDKDAIATYRYVLAEAEKMEDENTKAIAYCNLGYVYLFSNDYKKTLEYFESAISIGETTKEHYIMVVALNGLLEYYLRKQQLTLAEKTAIKVTALIQKTKSQENAVTTYRLLAELALHKKKFTEADKYLKKALTTSKQEGNLRDSAWSLLTAAKLALQKKKPQLAKKYLKEAESLTKQLNDTHCLTELSHLISQGK